jgi:uridine kinase
MYYKGVARIMTEKVIQRAEFKKFAPLCEQIYTTMLSVNKNDDLKDKFKQENVVLISRKLAPIVGAQNVEPIMRALYEEHSHINFDEPSTNKFRSLEKDLKALLRGETRTLSRYSFDFSECFDEQDMIKYKCQDEMIVDGSQYDVFCVEGLYMLRPEILNCFNPKDVATAFIDCDSPTLLARRYYRDIQLGRTTMLPEITIISSLNNVMPAYYTYILPTRNKAQHIHYASLTPLEVGQRRVSSQTKYPITEEQYQQILNTIYKKNPVGNETNGMCWEVARGLQQDVFFTDGGRKCPFNVRIRAVDGFVQTLTFKMGKNTTDRHIDNYNLNKICKNDHLSLDEISMAMLRSGFRCDARLTKYRESFAMQGWDGMYTINLDQMGDGERFVELDNASYFDARRFASSFRLTDAITKSYIDYFKDQMLNLEENEG